MTNNGNSMTQAQKADALLKQAELAYKMHNDRRQWEWKITLGLWAVILATIVEEITLPLWVWIITGAVYGFVWLRGIWVANENNKLWYEEAMKAAWDIAKNNRTDIPSRPSKVGCCKWCFGFLAAWAMFFQLVATAALMGLAYLKGIGCL